MKQKKTLPLFDVSVLPEATTPDTLIAGVDEVGRGALFGPVVAAAVALPISVISQLTDLGVKDSKQLSPKRRAELAAQIKTLTGIYHIGVVSAREIDEINILQASLRAMYQAIIELPVQPLVCLVDGRQKIPNLPMRQENLVKGDQRSPLIAAASIIGKVWRDEMIISWAEKYPQYDLAANKGYGTLKHRQALIKYGPSPQHRLSFRPCRVGEL